LFCWWRWWFPPPPPLCHATYSYSTSSTVSRIQNEVLTVEVQLHAQLTLTHPFWFQPHSYQL
jgi:hypothetical protein